MKVWITRDSAGSLHAGGLDRVQLWFTKPEYHVKRITKDDMENMPWFYAESQGLGDIGWRPGYSTREETRALNFAKVFGYSDRVNKQENKIADYVWDKLGEHFNGTSFPNGWQDEEKAGRSNQWDFLLELDVDFVFHI